MPDADRRRNGPPDPIPYPQDNWKNLRIHQIELMVSKSIFQDSGVSGSLESNFDPDFYTFLKENERLAKMDIAIPSVNQFLIKRKDYFSEYGDAVDMILFRWVILVSPSPCPFCEENRSTYRKLHLPRYNTAIRNIVPDLRRLFTPHVNRIRSCLEPGLADITWTDTEWAVFTERCLEDIDNFAHLMSRANDIYTNR